VEEFFLKDAATTEKHSTDLRVVRQVMGRQE